MCTSPRVADAIARPNVVSVPIAHEIGAALPLVDAPVAGILANWRWPANARALHHLLRSWPEVRALVPSARLLIGGHGLDGVGSIAGVEVIGRVEHSEDALAQMSVLAFPCPPTTGPKIKVLEAIGRGVPALTTSAGVEGLRLSAHSGAAITTPDRFAVDLAALLMDPARRAELAVRGRSDILANHAPVHAGAGWVEACRSLDPGAGSD